jgi:hypothetical protein
LKLRNGIAPQHEKSPRLPAVQGGRPPLCQSFRPARPPEEGRGAPAGYLGLSREGGEREQRGGGACGADIATEHPNTLSLGPAWFTTGVKIPLLINLTEHRLVRLISLTRLIFPVVSLFIYCRADG